VAQEIWNQSEIEERWQCLDPIFIMGMQRTGTSIMWRALRVAGFLGFPEGHLWFDLVEDFARFRDPEYKKYTREDIFVLGSDRNLALERRFALMIDRFHRDLLPSDLVRWVDKSPGHDTVIVAPMLAELFPRSQFIFMKRNAITTVNSTIARIPHIFRVTCENWARVMEAWRWVRPLLSDRCIEVAQEHIAEKPDQVAAQAAEFLHVPQFADAIAGVFRSRRENTSFPDKGIGDFIYPLNWTDEQTVMLTDICGEEMALWGYPIDFDEPGGPTRAHPTPAESPIGDMRDYYAWLSSGRQDIAQLIEERDQLLDLLKRINQGRVMRVLNKTDKYLRRLGLR
jgi:hypothetical protein